MNDDGKGMYKVLWKQEAEESCRRMTENTQRGIQTASQSGSWMSLHGKDRGENLGGSRSKNTQR